MSSIAGVLANQDRWHVEHCDVLEGLRQLPPESIHVICTSPPYWALRDYMIPPSIWGGDPACKHRFKSTEIPGGSGNGRSRRRDASGHFKRGQTQPGFCRCGAWKGCFGSEPTLDLYIEHLVAILTACYRVLRKDGTLWLNLGDCFSRDDKYGGTRGGKHADYLENQNQVRTKRRSTDAYRTDGLMKLLVPHRVALAAAASGWIVRDDVVWHKLSPMPSSVSATRWRQCRHKIGRDPQTRKAIYRDCEGCDKCLEFQGRRVRLQRGAWRCTTAHEFIFQLVKAEGYFGNAEAVKEKAVGDRPGNAIAGKMSGVTGDGGRVARLAANKLEWSACAHRNPRSVWSLPNEPLKEKHFAAFPSFIPRRCIQASTSDIGVCPECGANYAPVVEHLRVATRPGCNSKVGRASSNSESPYNGHRGDVVGNKDPRRHQSETRCIGWLPTCECHCVPESVGQLPPVPAVVLDIFCGSGTTGRVAYSLGRRFIGFEIAERYVSLARERIVKPFRKGKPVPKHKRPMDGQKPLFE